MPRRTLTANTAWDDIYNYIAYVEIALSLAAEDGDKEVAALVPPMQKLIGRWESLDGERRSQRTGTLRANALVALRNLDLDAATTRLHNAVLGAEDQNRQAPLFTRLFPKPLSQVVPLALETQLGGSRILLHNLQHDDTPAAIRKAHQEPFTDSIVAGEAAVKGRELARAMAQQMAAQVTALRVEANRVLLITEGGLKTIAGKRNLGPAFVNAFFPAARTPTKRRAAPAPAPAAAPAEH